MGEIGEEKELPLRPGDTTIRVTDVTRPTITVFRPMPEKETGAAVLICPGGGYGVLAFNKEGTEVAQWLNTIGVTGVVLKYRVPARKGRERYDAPLQDAQRALGIVRHRAKEWGIDPRRVGVLGFSAGGHLAAVLSHQHEKRTYEPVDDADRSAPARLRPADLSGLPDDSRSKTTCSSPEGEGLARDTPDLPGPDRGRRRPGRMQPRLLQSDLKDAKVPAEMHLYPSGGHGYGLRPSDHTVSTWPRRARNGCSRSASWSGRNRPEDRVVAVASGSGYC